MISGPGIGFDLQSHGSWVAGLLYITTVESQVVYLEFDVPFVGG